MSELKDKRLLFTRFLCDLIMWGNSQPGWQIALGRDFDEEYEKTADGKPVRHMRGSLHYRGLANDLALYIDGIYQTTTEAYAPLGKRWKMLHRDLHWGGDFFDKKGKPKPDGNHFSITFEGKA